MPWQCQTLAAHIMILDSGRLERVVIIKPPIKEALPLVMKPKLVLRALVKTVAYSVHSSGLSACLYPILNTQCKY
jgi:hypothetical protein